MTLISRLTSDEVRHRPGPQDKHLITQHSHVGKAPKWSFHGQLESPPAKSDVPGPYGPVDPNRDSHGKYSRDPAFSFKGSSGATSRIKSAWNPGPTAFEDKTASRAPSYGFSSSKRGSRGGCLGSSEPSSEASPGPGAYLCNSKEGGPKYSMAPRLDGPHRVTAGPGAAFRWPECAPNTTPRFPVGRPSSSRRPRSAGRVGPGPAAYPPRSMIGSAPSYSLGARPKEFLHEKRELGGPFTTFGY